MIAKAERRTKRKAKKTARRGRPLLVADLFCGAGGSSTGCRRALARRGLKMKLVAVNHWPVAIETHQKNHPDARHYCVNLDAAQPRTLVPEGRLDLLMASPECTHHSQARGGKPISDQSRMSAWHVVRWATELRVRVILVENVPEFRTWGPLDSSDRPVADRKGEYFNAWVAALEAVGFKVEWRILNAADYGDATTRKRFFLIARSDGRAIEWPRQSHHEDGVGRRRWRAAREIIDWSLEGRSIFDRARPLAPKTLLRIYAGALKFGWDEPYLVVLRQHMATQGLDVPLPTVAAQGNHLAVARVRRRLERGEAQQPFLLPQGQQDPTRTAENPLPTATTVARIGLVEGPPPPFVLNRHGENGAAARAHDPEKPLPTADGRGAGYLVEPRARPFVEANRTNNVAKDPEAEPLPGITTTTGGGLFLVEPREKGGAEGLWDKLASPEERAKAARAEGRPLVMRTAMHNSNGLCVRDAADPLPAVTTDGGMALLLPQGGGGAPRAVDRPAPTVQCDGAVALVSPYNRTGLPVPVTQPVPTLLGHGMAGLVVPVTHDDASCRARSVESPLPTITSAPRGELAAVVARAAQKNAFMLAAFGERKGQKARVRGVDKPTPTVCAKGRVPLVAPEEREVDILFRMLEPHELAAAMGFSDAETTYEFVGNKTEVTKQIGNAVPVGLAAALVGAIFRRESA